MGRVKSSWPPTFYALGLYRSGRCQEALSDFDDVLRSSAGSAPSEAARALYGRASCRARTGDLAGAEQDRQRYLKEFPKGPAARQLTSPP